MTVGSAELSVNNLDAMDNEQLVAQIKKSKEELFNLRFQSATDQLDNHGRLKAVKRDVARIYTVLRERDLGLRTEPSVAETAKADQKEEKKSKSKEKEA
jgi:large subunit ribosomal protein L29